MGTSPGTAGQAGQLGGGEVDKSAGAGMLAGAAKIVGAVRCLGVAMLALTVKLTEAVMPDVISIEINESFERLFLVSQA